MNEQSLENDSGMTIGALAQATDVNIETVRYYQRRGLLQTPKRPLGSIRRYGREAVERVQFIKRTQRLGFSLAEIEKMFALDAVRDRDAAHDFARSKIAEIDARLRDLKAVKQVLAELVNACEHGDRSKPCPIVEAFHHSPKARKK